MPSSVFDMTIFRGDTTIRTITFTDGDGDPIDITGWTVFFTVKSCIDDTDSAAVLKKTITIHSNPTAGITMLNISADDVNELDGSYWYDIQIKKGDGTIKTAVVANFIVDKDVTRRIV